MIFQIFEIIIMCLSLSISPMLSVANNTSCYQSCSERSVPYPFGFSDGCPIKLNCSGNSRAAEIGDFVVQNVTSDQVLVEVPAGCNRSAAKLLGLFSKNFAPTTGNVLLFADCKSPLGDCSIPDKLAWSEFGDEACNSTRKNARPRNISCYIGGTDDGDKFLNYRNVGNRGNCSILFSSIMVDLNENVRSVRGNSSMSLVFQMIELGWWLNGECHCHQNAYCTKTRYNGQLGFRCKCNEGYSGDGFTKGTGCRKDPRVSVPECSAPKNIPVHCGETKVGIIFGVVVAGASVLTIVLAATCICIKRKYTSLKSRSFAMHLLSEAVGNTSIPFYPYKEIESATNGFSQNQRLGTGAYGTVYAGKLHNDELVAIKKIKYQDHDSVDQVMNEIKLISSVSHPNLVRLLGCCIENNKQILVYEYMPNGTLSQHLQRERGSVLPWTIRLTIAAETAHAIAHLHSAIKPPIYHRDIKSSNILLDYSFKSKVADFGLSRFGMMDYSHVSTAPQGTPGYVDPQYHQNFHLSDKSDVYSFGVVLAEIITAKKAVDFSRPHSEINLAALALDRIGRGHIDDIIDPFLEPNRDAWTLSSVHKVAELAFRCLAFHRDMRPLMMEVANELEHIRLSGWAPTEENICMESSVSSFCSSPCLGSEKSQNTFTTKVGAGNRRSISALGAGDALLTAEKAIDGFPVSVQDPWLIKESTPSLNSLLGKAS